MCIFAAYQTKVFGINPDIFELLLNERVFSLLTKKVVGINPDISELLLNE